MNAVTDKDDRCINRSRTLPGFIFRHNLGTVGEIDRRALRWHKRKFCFVFVSVHRKERNLLEIGPVVAGGLQALKRKLRGNVLSRKLGAARPWPAAFEQIEREKAHMRANLARIDGFSGLARRYGQSVDSGHGGRLLGVKKGDCQKK